MSARHWKKNQCAQCHLPVATESWNPYIGCEWGSIRCGQTSTWEQAYECMRVSVYLHICKLYLRVDLPTRHYYFDVYISRCRSIQMLNNDSVCDNNGICPVHFYNPAQVTRHSTLHTHNSAITNNERVSVPNTNKRDVWRGWRTKWIKRQINIIQPHVK